MYGGQNTYPAKKNNSICKYHQKIFTTDINDIKSTYKAKTYVSIANNNIKMKKDETRFKINYDKKIIFRILIISKERTHLKAHLNMKKSLKKEKILLLNR